MQTTLLQRYEGQRAYWSRNSTLVSVKYFERELPRAFALADTDPAMALGSLTALCASLLELAKECDPAYSLEKDNNG